MGQNTKMTNKDTRILFLGWGVGFAEWPSETEGPSYVAAFKRGNKKKSGGGYKREISATSYLSSQNARNNRHYFCEIKTA